MNATDSIPASDYCYYSGLPSPAAYMEADEVVPELAKEPLTPESIDRIIEMAWEDRTPFEAIRVQFGLKEDEVRSLMKSQLRFKSYILWRKRVEKCNTKHNSKRNPEIGRFKANRQRSISGNKIT